MHPNFIPAFERTLKNYRNYVNVGSPFGHPREACSMIAKHLKTHLSFLNSEEYNEEEGEKSEYVVRYFMRGEVQGAFSYINAYKEVIEDEPTFMRIYVLYAYCDGGMPDYKSLLRLAEGVYDDDLERGKIPSIFDRAIEMHERLCSYMEADKEYEKMRHIVQNRIDVMKERE